MASTPLLLFDNDALLHVLTEGVFKIQPIGFEATRAIVDMHSTEDIVRCFKNADIEKIIYEYLDIQKRPYFYEEVPEMLPEQDAILFRLYITESETQPVIQTEYGTEAKKIQNVYVHCQLVSRLE